MNHIVDIGWPDVNSIGSKKERKMVHESIVRCCREIVLGIPLRYVPGSNVVTLRRLQSLQRKSSIVRNTRVGTSTVGSPSVENSASFQGELVYDAIVNFVES